VNLFDIGMIGCPCENLRDHPALARHAQAMFRASGLDRCLSLCSLCSHGLL
jgi:hypothetical protein